MTEPSQATWLARREFGRTGLQVDPLCVGCAPLGDMPETFAYSVPEEQALATLRAVFDGRINFLDTAAWYGDGESERRIGLVLHELGGLPPGYVLATKADRHPATNDFSGDQTRRSVERSLRLLGLDSLQVLYLHDPEYVTWEEINAPGGALEVLLQYRDQGVIQHLGVAGGPIDLLMRYCELGVFEAVITHNRYNLLTREAEPLLDMASRMGLAVVNAAPYGSGILAKGPENYPRFRYGEASPEMMERAYRLQEICARHGVPLPAAALQFSLRDARVTSTIVGMSKPERVQQTVDLARQPISEEAWAEIMAAAAPGA
jgi:D-threo-aldose 1-dehydrogenase